MTLRRSLVWLLALLVAVILAGGWYARVAWEEWKQAASIRNLEWQGVDVSLGGVQLERFSVTQMRDDQPYRVEGEQLSLGWSWHWYGPLPDLVNVGRLTVDIPAWPGSSRQEQPATELPRQLPSWLPENIDIDQLVLTLPDGIRAAGDLTVSQLSSPDTRRVATNAMKIEAPAPGMTLSGWRLGDSRASLVVAGEANEQSATLDVSDESHIVLARVDGPGNAVQLDKLRINLAGTNLAASYSLRPAALQKLVFKGPVAATAAAIHHPQLRLQPWRLNGLMDSSLEGLNFDGKLAANAGTEADIGLRVPFDGTPELDVGMTVSGAEGGQGMADTFTAWPKALEIGDGSIRATLKLRLPPDGTQLQGEINSDGLGGLFGRTAFAGLSGKANIDLTGDRLDVRTTGLKIDRVNPGIALNTIQVAGRYRSTTAKITAGTLKLEQASAKLLGGNLRIEPAEWQLSQTPLKIPLQLSGIELSQLMQVYPAEGLAGSGTLRGTVPLRISGKEVSIEAGQVEALSPGGTLKLPADRLSGMAQGNEAMELVVRAMQNFNYSVLSSTVDYDQDGKLTLGLRLEGSSPDVRDGHPIVLNINLEEDIPALLTSLQLSGRVNEAVTEKVRNLMQKRDAEQQSTGSDN